MKFRISLALLCTFMVFTLGCEWLRPRDRIVIGEFMTKSGADATFGMHAKQGVDLAVEEANAAGGIDGKKIVVDSVDPRGQKSSIEKFVRDFAERNEVMAVVGEIASERSNWAAHVAQEEALPMISPSSTNPSVTEKGEYIFRACYIDPFQGYAMARFARDQGYKRVGVIINERSNYSVGLSEFFIDTFRQLGGVIAAEETYTPTEGAIRLDSQAAVIKKARVDALFIPVYYAEAAAIAKDLRQRGVKAQFLGGDGWDSQDLFALGAEAVDGAYFTNHFSAQSTEPAAREFVRKFKERFGTEPDGTAAMGYDAASMIIAALRNLVARGEALTRAALRSELAKTRNLAGVTGPITMDENRNASKPVVILRARQGKFEYVKTIMPK